MLESSCCSGQSPWGLNDKDRHFTQILLVNSKPRVFQEPGILTWGRKFTSPPNLFPPPRNQRHWLQLPALKPPSSSKKTPAVPWRSHLHPQKTDPCYTMGILVTLFRALARLSVSGAGSQPSLESPQCYHLSICGIDGSDSRPFTSSPEIYIFVLTLLNLLKHKTVSWL